MHKLLGVKIVSKNPLRVWWNAEFVTSDGAIHQNAPAPDVDASPSPLGVPLGSGGYVLGIPGDPMDCDKHCPEAAEALRAATTNADIIAAVNIDAQRVARHYENQVSNAPPPAIDLLPRRPS